MGIYDVKNIDNFYIRYQKDVGLFMYSCKSGLIYAISNSYILKNYSSINEQDWDFILKDITQNITFGFSQQLPTEKDWPGTLKEKLNNPLTINWLLSKECTHKCLYCYAADVMKSEEYPYNDDIRSIAKSILSYKPLNVVLSGGEPLLSKNINKAIEYLAGKTGITIDTNGYCIEKLIELMPLIISNKINVRISLDSLRLSELYKTRPIIDQKIDELENFERLLKTITILIDNKVNISIQTVLTAAGTVLKY